MDSKSLNFLPVNFYGFRNKNFFYQLIDYLKIEFRYSCITAYLLRKLLNGR